MSRRVFRREPALAGSSSSRQIDTHLSDATPREAAGLRRSVHAPEMRRRRTRDACGEARRAEAAAAASIPMAPLRWRWQWRWRRRDYSCSLHRTRSRRRVQAQVRARRKVPEASGSMGLQDCSLILMVRRRRRGERASERGGAPRCPTPIQGSGQWRGRWRDRRGPISRLMWIKRMKIFFSSLVMLDEKPRISRARDVPFWSTASLQLHGNLHGIYRAGSTYSS